MDERIFRKKSLEKMNSPEELSDFVRVINPGVWVLLIGIIVLLAGALVWAVFGHVEDTVRVTAAAENGVITCTVENENIEQGAVLRIADAEYAVESVGYAEGTGIRLCTVTAKADIPDGVYEGYIVIGQQSPISLTVN